MAEYIDREKLIRYTEKQEVIIKDGTSIADAMRIQGNVFRRCVETAPAAEVVEVVRCKDCKHYYTDDGCDGWYACDIAGGLYEPDALDFCSYGERKEQG